MTRRVVLSRPANPVGHRVRVGLAVAALVLIAVPTALGAKPIRTVLPITRSFVIPAGFGCSFDVGGQPDEDARQAITEFSDGRVQIIGHAQVTLTNLETGDSFVQRSRPRLTVTYDQQTNDEFWEIDGRFFISLFPGDQGPFGEVGEDGALVSVMGNQEFTVDLDTEVVTSYSLDGHAIDICAQLAP